MLVRPGLTDEGPVFGSQLGGLTLYAMVSVSPTCARASLDQSSACSAGALNAAAAVVARRKSRRLAECMAAPARLFRTYFQGGWCCAINCVPQVLCHAF